MTARSPGTRTWEAALFAVATLWLGMLLGVSFLATPAKFLAPSLTLPAALDVGRHTFALFNKVEWALGAALLLMLVVGVRAWLSILCAIVASLGVIAETFWLRPVLDQRVGLIIAGQRPAASYQHNLYIILEVAKLIALAWWRSTWRGSSRAGRVRLVRAESLIVRAILQPLNKTQYELGGSTNATRCRASDRVTTFPPADASRSP